MAAEATAFEVPTRVHLRRSRAARRYSSQAGSWDWKWIDWRQGRVPSARSLVRRLASGDRTATTVTTSPDFREGLSWRCVKSVGMTLLSCLFLAITFGALIRKKSHGAIGVLDALVATSGGGILFALFATQPLMIVGVTGPMLVFEESLYKFSNTLGEGEQESYLAMRFWVSAWALLFCVATVAFEGTYLVKYVTRFSDDILLSLLSAIFIYESFSFLGKTLSEHPLKPRNYYCPDQGNSSARLHKRSLASDFLLSDNSTDQSHNSSASAGDGQIGYFSTKNEPNTALLAVLFLLGTFLLAHFINRLRTSNLFGRSFRRGIGDFSLSIAVVSMVLVDYYIVGPNNVGTGKVQLAHISRHTGHLAVEPWPVGFQSLALSVLPGLFLFFVVFLENEVLEVELAKKEHALVKGTGFHWDLILTSLLNFVCSVLGLPWLCGAPVRTQAHLHSLSVYQLRAPGEKPRVERVVEQRVTGVVLHLLIGSTVFLGSVIEEIPVSVLFGVFLFIGMNNLKGVQMLSRTLLFFVPLKYHPHQLYCLRVGRWRMHLFTVIQLVCFVVVCLVKWCPVISFAFPLAVALTCLLRHSLLPRIFTAVELMAVNFYSTTASNHEAADKEVIFQLDSHE